MKALGRSCERRSRKSIGVYPRLRSRSHNIIGMSLAIPGLGHTSSSISHPFPYSSAFANLLTKPACRRARKTRCLRWHLANTMTFQGEVNPRGKIIRSDPEERAKVQVKSFKVQSSLARCCERHREFSVAKPKLTVR